jgi:thioredoxin reductase (NADPH)
VASIHKAKIEITTNGEVRELKNDFVFVFAGAEMPHKFLMSLGIQIDKKFGESLKGKAI